MEQRTQVVRRFVAFTNDYPWRWTVADAEEWTAELVARGLAHSTIRHYQQQAGLFLAYLTDARYGWDQVCEQHFGTHPVQVFHQWNTAVHRTDAEARPGNRPPSRAELQALFDFCDQRVATVRRSGRKGWLAAYRDATLFKTVYAWGLRRQETARLETVDWSPNAAAPEFGRYGAVSVRYGKAMRGSPPRRRTVLTTMGWAAEAVAEWVEEIRPAYQTRGTTMWPTERGGRVTNDYMHDRLKIIQHQAGHSWGSTTAIYTTVGSDYKNKALRRALDRAFTPQPAPRSGNP